MLLFLKGDYRNSQHELVEIIIGEYRTDTPLAEISRELNNVFSEIQISGLECVSDFEPRKFALNLKKKKGVTFTDCKWEGKRLPFPLVAGNPYPKHWFEKEFRNA